MDDADKANFLMHVDCRILFLMLNNSLNKCTDG